MFLLWNNAGAINFCNIRLKTLDDCVTFYLDKKNMDFDECIDMFSPPKIKQEQQDDHQLLCKNRKRDKPEIGKIDE
jgi:hypothetical protein